MNIMEKDLMPSIIYIAIFLCVLLLATVIIITSLNSGNTQIGRNITGNATETLLDINTTQTLSASLVNAQCTVNSVTDLDGNLINSSNYTVNNCQITYHP